MRKRSVTALAVVLAMLVTVFFAEPASAGFTPPAAKGIGDPYFPLQGNGGYDVLDYDIAVRYDPTQTEMYGVTTITATATQNLQTFYLDFAGMNVRSVNVNGEPVAWARVGDDLEISKLFGFPYPAGSSMNITVVYDGTPRSAITRYDYKNAGWIRTLDGIIVASQPNGAATWFPSNNHPSDEATVAVTITVPPGVAAVSNGLPGPTTVGADGWETTRWSSPDLMATYLVTAAIGDYEVTTGTVNGIPAINAVGSYRASNVEELTRHSEVLQFLEGYLGAYPFSSTGAIVSSDSFGYALETQGRPVYSGGFFFSADSHEALQVMAHEEAHQWFGNQVTLAGWSDIWLNEGMASYMHWLWNEHEGNETVDQIFERLACRPSTDPGWRAPGAPGPSQLFAEFVYDRGAMTLQALRRTIGDQQFFTLLRQWAAPGNGAPRTTADFTSMAESVSGMQLDDLFNTWLYTPGKPSELTCNSVSIPGGPTEIAVTRDTATGSATISWKPPVSNGGGYITGFTVGREDLTTTSGPVK